MRIALNSLAPLLAVMMVLSLGAASRAQTTPPGYALIWAEEFHQTVGEAPDPARWQYNTGNNNGWGNAELENYVSDTEHAHTVADPDATDGRALQIEATSDGQGHYESARIFTSGKVAFRYGYITARIKLPLGKGIWPAFWMLGQDIAQVGWPGCGEMDIMENLGSQPSVNHGSFHGPGYSGSHSLTASYTLPNGKRFTDGYHTFALQWSPDAATYSVDGHAYETRTPADVPKGGTWAFNRPFFFVLNLAVGGHWPGSPDTTTTFPQTLRVDYIRVYQRSAPPVGHTISLKALADKQYVSVTPAGPLVAGATVAGAREKFLVVGRGKTEVALRSLATGTYIGVTADGTLTAAHASVGPTETFRWVDTGDGGATLWSLSAHKYVSADDTGKNPLTAGRVASDAWETFAVTKN